MVKVENAHRSSIPAAEWVRRLAQESTAFEIVSVLEGEVIGKSPRKVQWDQVVKLSVGPDERKIDLFVLARRQLLPNAVLGLFEKLEEDRPDGVVLLCVPYISSRVAEMCRERGISYLDEVGNCWISAPGFFVHIEGRANSPTTTKAINPFSKKSSRIVRTLLTYPSKGWQVQQLARRASVSLGLASKAKNALVNDAYLEERDRLLFIRDAVKLLQKWSDEYRPHVRRVQLFAIARPIEIEKRLAEWCRENQVTYALTQLTAAWRYSPMVRYDKSVAYIDKMMESADSLKSLLQHLDAKEVETGANCILWITDDPAVFTDSKEIDGIRVVSPLQLYLDLMVLPGRGKDAAEEIFEKELRPSLAASNQSQETADE